MSLPEATRLAAARRDVPGDVLEAAFGEIMDGRATPVGIAALLVALRTKGETVDEIVAIARAMRAHAETAPLPDPRCIDTCGTGGDGAGTFNVSTVAAFVVAGAGVPVAKHGNRAASSKTGSADVLEALGVEPDLPIPVAARLVREVGIGFLYARRAHPAMRHVAPVRAELGFRTVMNCLGPLSNPVGAKRQLVGVYDAALVVPIALALGRLGAERALVVHGDDGLDELTTTGGSATALWDGGGAVAGRVEPEALGLALAAPAALRGGDPVQNAEIARAVLGGSPGPARDIVLLNAAAALFVADAAASIADGLGAAARSIDSGAARERLAALAAASRAARAALA
ncbi:MAG TPA: anthranilate phosphoribosyltransferase [Myxococcota bacterium]|nr:anthranilate phosphoribosyltransferase [Myxococcota bacterium]